jgi:hypothetical protein
MHFACASHPNAPAATSSSRQSIFVAAELCDVILFVVAL